MHYERDNYERDEEKTIPLRNIELLICSQHSQQMSYYDELFEAQQSQRKSCCHYFLPYPDGSSYYMHGAGGRGQDQLISSLHHKHDV